MDALLIYLLLFGGVGACAAIAGLFVFAGHRRRIAAVAALALFCLSLLVLGRESAGRPVKTISGYFSGCAFSSFNQIATFVAAGAPGKVVGNAGSFDGEVLS